MKQCKKMLFDCYVNSLKVAKEHHIKSISFPSLGTGIYGNPLEQSANIAISAVLYFEQEFRYDLRNLQTWRYVSKRRPAQRHGICEAALLESLQFGTRLGTLGNYPDTCLRILKFCKEDCPPDLYADIAKDAVEGFRERVLADDRFAGKLYEQALGIYQSIKE